MLSARLALTLAILILLHKPARGARVSGPAASKAVPELRPAVQVEEAIDNANLLVSPIGGAAKGEDEGEVASREAANGGRDRSPVGSTRGHVRRDSNGKAGSGAGLVWRNPSSPGGSSAGDPAGGAGDPGPGSPLGSSGSSGSSPRSVLHAAAEPSQARKPGTGRPAEPRRPEEEAKDFTVSPAEASRFVDIIGGEEALLAALKQATEQVVKSYNDISELKAEFIRYVSMSQHLDYETLRQDEFFKEFGTFVNDNKKNKAFLDWLSSESAGDAMIKEGGMSEREVRFARRAIAHITTSMTAINKPNNASKNNGDFIRVQFSFPPDSPPIELAKVAVQKHASVFMKEPGKFVLACKGERQVRRLDFFSGETVTGRHTLQAWLSGPGGGLFPSLQPWFVSPDHGYDDLAFFARLGKEVWSYNAELVDTVLAWKANPQRTEAAVPGLLAFTAARSAQMPFVKVLDVHFVKSGEVDLRHKCIGARDMSQLTWLMRNGVKEVKLWTSGVDV